MGSHARNIPVIASGGEDITTGLVIYLPLQGNLNDASGNGNNGTFLNGTATYTTAFGGQQALVFDGVNDRLNVARDASYDNPSAYTITACFHLTTAGGNGSGRLYSFQDFAGAANDRITAWIIASGAEYELQHQESRWSTSAGRWGSGTASITLTTDFHGAVRYDTVSTAENADIFLDGVLQALNELQTPQGTITANSGSVDVGNRLGDARAFHGHIAHFRLYTITKTDAEIAAIRAADCP